MQLSIRNAAGRSELIEQQAVAGRTVLRLKQGERLEIVDPSTGATPAGVKARRGANGKDLIVEGAGETVLIEGFFDEVAQGEEAVAVEFPGGAAPEITPATPELAMPGTMIDAGMAMAGNTGYATLAQAGAAAGAAGTGSGAATAGAAGAGAAAGSSNLLWIAGGVAGAGAAGAALENNNDKGSKTATFELARSAASVDEGGTVTFTLNTTNVAAGTQYAYTITGVSASDVEGGALSGVVTVDASGRAVIELRLAADLTTEGAETLTLSVAGQTSSVVVNDVSTTLVPTFALTASSATVDEGDGVSFTLITTNVAPGTQYAYVITGIAPADIVGGASAMAGLVTIDSNGRAILEIELVADATTEGLETLTLQIAGQTVSVNVNDLSVTPTYLLTVNQDNVVGTSFDDLVVGTHLTFNSGDIIDGGAGYDKLELTMQGGTVAAARVSNVEALELNALAGGGDVAIDMRNFDSSLQQINIEAQAASVSLANMQSVADVMVSDAGEDTSLNLSYGANAVAGENDTLSLTVDNVRGEITVGAGIEAIDLQVNGDAYNSIDLTAASVTDLTVRGGAAGQRLNLDVGLNESGGGTFDSREFAGGVHLANVDGGYSSFGYSVALTQGLLDGETATLRIGGLEISFTADGSDYSQHELGVQLSTMLAEYGFSSAPYELTDELTSLIIANLAGPMQITVDVAGTALSVLDTFDYTDLGGSSSESYNFATAAEFSTVLLGAGEDSVYVSNGNIAYGDTYDLGEGNNYLSANDNVHGTVRFGTGHDYLTVGEDLGAGADVNFGEGDNYLDVGGAINGDASIRFGAGNNRVEADVIEQAARIEFGAGDNLLASNTIGHSATATFGDGANTFRFNTMSGSATATFGNGDNSVELYGEDARLQDDARITFGDGDNYVWSDNGEDGVSIQDGAQLIFGDGHNVVALQGGEDTHIRNEAELSFGNGDNVLYVNGQISDAATISFGDGDNVLVARVVYSDVAIEFGQGDNLMGVDYSLSDSSVTFGDGDNRLWVDDGVYGATVTFGEGNNYFEAGGVGASVVTFGSGDNYVEIEHHVDVSNFTFGSGADEMWVGDTIRDGSTLDFGAGDDTLAMGSSSGPVHLAGEDVATVVDMGSGDDTVDIFTGEEVVSDVIVRSGAFLRGGEGNDTLIVRSYEDISVVARTDAQETYVGFTDDSYAVDQVVTVTIAGVEYSYTVQAIDIVQGNPEATRINVAAGVFSVIDEEGDCTLTPCLGDEGPYIKLTGSVGAADVEVTVTGGETYTAQIGDTGISGFETLSLVASNPLDRDSCDTEAATITADFSLIEGVQRINLTSEATIETHVNDADTNGVYDAKSAGSRAGFVLQNLPADLAGPITVSANEVTAYGNRQVARVYINEQSGVDGHAIGDVITVSIGDQEFSITVTEADLSGADGLEDAETIAARLAEVIAAGETGFTVARDGNMITLIGSSDEDVEIELEGKGDSLDDCVQSASASDDREIDVTLTAHLAEDGDTDGDTLALEIDGEGNFDLSIDAARESKDGLVAYEHLSIDVQDEYSHYIDTNPNCDIKAFNRGNLSLTGGAIGASIVLDNVMAANVTSTSAANVEVIFASEADGEDQYDFNVSTQSGDDVVDMRDVLFSHRSNVNLGDGVDRLLISNGRHDAEEALGGSVSTDEGRMFRNVRGVEELQFVGEDAITFDDDAYNAGFNKLIVEEGSDLQFKVGDEFERDLSVEIEDCVDLEMEVYNKNAITVTAHDNATVGAMIHEDAEGDFTLTANDYNTITVNSAGSGAVNVTVDDENEVVITQAGEGDVTVFSDSDNSVNVTQLGAGDVHVTTEDESYVGITIGADAEDVGGVTVVQTDSDYNRISLEGLRQEQNVTVDITVHGDGESSLIADLCDTEEYNTDLEVFGSTGGIDTLTVRTNEEYGASAYVGVVTEDSWAVAEGEDRTAIDMTIDASTVDAEFLIVNAMKETDANLEIIGSSTATNVLLGGAGRDTIKGGEGMDVLQGDRASEDFRSYVVAFQSEESSYSLSIGEQTLVFSPQGVVDGTAVAEAFADYINGLGADVTGPDWSGAYEAYVYEGELFVTARSLNDSFELTATGASNVEAIDWGLGGGIASDILEGGEGTAVYLFAESQFDTMDTIVGLNLGGATDGTQEDVVMLGAYLPADGEADDLGFFDLIDEGVSSKNSIEVERVVNGGEAITLTGADLESAVSRLFEANGWFEASGSAANNSAGLFNYGDDTYLIAVGNDASGGFGIDDYIIKVTGVTGALDVSDFYIPMPPV